MITLMANTIDLDIQAILHKARDLIVDPRRWFQGPITEGARDANGKSVAADSEQAVRWTLRGACEAACGGRVEAVEFLLRRAAHNCGYDIDLIDLDHYADSRMAHARDIKILDAAIGLASSAVSEPAEQIA